MSVESVDLLREKQDKEELQEVIGTSISALAGHCSEQMLLRIWSIGINKGIEIGRQMALRAENEKLRRIS